MKRKFVTSVFALAIIVLFGSCASIIHGPTQPVDFSSQPAGAKIIIDGKTYGITPKTLILRRNGRFSGQSGDKKEYAATIQLDGYYPYDIKIKRDMDGWFIGNLVFGGLIGIIIDASNGAMYKLSPDQVIAQMGKNTVDNQNRSGKGLYIAVTLTPDPNWEKIGNLAKMK